MKNKMNMLNNYSLLYYTTSEFNEIILLTDKCLYNIILINNIIFTRHTHTRRVLISQK